MRYVVTVRCSKGKSSSQVLILTSHAFHRKLISTDYYVLADDISSSNLDQFRSKRSQPTQRNSLKLNRSTHIN